MKKKARFTALFMSMVMVLSLQISTFAKEETQPVKIEQPSEWAHDGVQWASVYKLAKQSMFGEYNSSVKRQELYSVCASVYERVTGVDIIPLEKSPFEDSNDVDVLKACAANILTGRGKFEPQKEATRMDVLKGFYNLIKVAKPHFDFKVDSKLDFEDVNTIPQDSIDTVKYTFSKGILKGRENKKLDLDNVCTRQELMVFAKKVYEFVINQPDNNSKGAIWRVEDENSSVYLVGSIHVADSTIYPLSKKLIDAYEGSDILVVEADIANQEEGIQYMQEKMMYTDGTTLDRKIPKELYERFVEVVESYGIPEETYSKFKPWYAALLIQSVQLMQSEHNTNNGVDLFFLSKAIGNKPILEMEGIKFQTDMFDSFSVELQIEFLEGVLSDEKEVIEEQEDIMGDIIKAWKAGDIGSLEKLLKVEDAHSEIMKEFNQKIFLVRNENMVQKVKVYLEDPENKTYFVVVGAGHMVGENGIVNQLDDEFEVNQVK